MQHNDSRGEILKETMNQVLDILGADIQNITVERVAIGIFYTGVKLSNGDGGICFTPIKSIPEAVCCPSSARVMPSSGKLKGRSVTYFLDDMFAESHMKRALSIAVLNALSATCWRLSPPKTYEFKIDSDPLDHLTVPDEAQVVVVGALVPYIRMLKKRGKPFTILELDSRTLKEDELPYWVPPEKSSESVAQSDFLIITGTTLINDTLENLLQNAKPGAQIVVVGPTVSMLPDAFYRRGVTSLGGIAVTKPDLLLDTLNEAGSGYHFYGKSAERLVVQKI
jgi:uncharacterized protein (DUF4213/DUF364 family)